MNTIYKKSELLFAIIWIIIYCAAQSLSMPLSKAIGIESSGALIVGAVLSVILIVWIVRHDKTKKYGLCRTGVPAKKFIWYIPFVIIISQNLWNGAAVNLSAADTVSYILSMVFVGFLEEVIFRGLLFRAIEKDGVKAAVIISSVTFGVGHLLNLVNGSGMSLISNLCQIFGAIAIGFLFVTMFYRGGSLLPCIFAHAAINSISAFANETGLTDEKIIIFSVISTVVAVVYTLILTRTLPQNNSQIKITVNGAKR